MKKFLTAVFALSFITTIQAQSKNYLDQPIVEVNGRYDSLLTPNEIYIKIIISEKDNKGKVSVEELERNMIDALKKLSINTEKDLVVSDMSNNFKSYLLKKTDILTSKEYQLKVGDAKTVSRVFVSLEALGISNTSIDRVDHSDLEKIKNEIRSKAVENAKQKAWALVKPLNQTIGIAIHIVDYDNGYTPQPRNSGILMKAAPLADAEMEPANIDFEKIKISSSVNVVFILK